MSKKATANEPFLPFFVGDFFAATYEWEGEAISLYATLLLHQWASGSIPGDPKRICKLIKWDWEIFQTHWKVVRRKFDTIVMKNADDEDEERMINSRLERHRDKTRELSEKNAAAGRKGAEKRWQKDSERHTENMANATNQDGERHIYEMANANRKDGERHQNAMANATETGSPVNSETGDDDAENGERHRKGMANAIKNDGIHPIPSHPIPSQSQNTASDISPNLDTSSGAQRDLSLPPGSSTGEREGKGQDSNGAGQPPTAPPAAKSVARTTGATKRTRADSRGSRVPIPFVITDELREWAKGEAPGVDLEKGTREFVDYWKGVSGQKGCKLDWDATWRNRMRVLQERVGERAERRSDIRSGFALEWARVKDEARSEGFRQPHPEERIEDFRDALKRHVRGETEKSASRMREFGVDVSAAAKAMKP